MAKGIKNQKYSGLKENSYGSIFSRWEKNSFILGLFYKTLSEIKLYLQETQNFEDLLMWKSEIHREGQDRDLPSVYSPQSHSDQRDPLKPESRVSSGHPTEVVESQRLGPSSTAFARPLAESRLEAEQLGHELTHMRCSLTHYNIMLAL